MAGSWNHMTTKSGKFRSNETFTDLIENGGDAYEAAKECYGMVQYLASRMSRAVIGPDGPQAELDILRKSLIEEAQANYKEGLKIGGVQRPR
jgi:hypothetical protein